MNTSKKIIFTADDFGLKKSRDEAILEGYTKGFLTSACVCANGETFLSAMKEVLPQCVKNDKKMDIGVHLNIVEGKSITDCSLLVYESGIFKHDFVSLLLNSFNYEFLSQIEKEFRAQIENVQKEANAIGFEVSFINSHVHIHAIPNIFKIVKKLAKEYKIPFIRTQKEIPALLYEIKPVNMLKIAVLQVLNLFNQADITNNYIIGVGHTANMNKNAVFFGAEKLSDKNCIVEILLHPDLDPLNSSGFLEHQTTLDLDLKASIEKLGFKFINILDIKDGD